MRVEKINLKTLPLARWFGLTLGFLVSASALAATSVPTPTVKGRAPVMAVAYIGSSDDNSNDIVDTGDVLRATPGSFSDADGDIQVASTYRWNDGTTDKGTQSAYTVQASDLGKTITVYITPRTDATITDPSFGAEVNASIKVAAVGVVTSVTITGAATVGSALTAAPTCLGGTCTGTRTYEWMIETAAGTGTYSVVPSATSATYTPIRTDQRRKIQANVN
jgi:hypothetical protein